MLVSILLRDALHTGLRGLFPMSLRTLPVSVEYRYYPIVALYSLAVTDSLCISGAQSALAAIFIALGSGSLGGVEESERNGNQRCWDTSW